MICYAVIDTNVLISAIEKYGVFIEPMPTDD